MRLLKRSCAIHLVFGVLFFCSIARGEQYSFVTFHYPPYSFATEHLHAEGGIVEVVKAVMSNLGHQVNIRAFPWTRALKMVRTGRADAIFTAYKTPERKQFLDYSKEVLFPQSVFFYKKEGETSAFEGDLEALRSKKIGVVSTISYGGIFEQHKRDLQLDRATHLTQSFNKLMKERIDLVPSDRNVAEYTLKKLGISDEIVRIATKLESVPSYIAFSKKRNLTILRDDFDRELVKMRQTGEYQTILRENGINQGSTQK